MKKLIALVLSFGLYMFNSSSSQAGITFLTDWEPYEIKSDSTASIDPCAEFLDDHGRPIYHRASQCPKPKIFDERCPFDHGYISRCHCPANYDQDCRYPFVGDTRISENGYSSCDGLFLACCDSRCPQGMQHTKPGYYSRTNTDGCGQTCYFPCTPSMSDTSCHN